MKIFRFKRGRAAGAPSWTNRALVVLYLTGLLIMLVTMVVIRFRLDRLVEITV
ncbi:hypothetical protein SAMN05920897_10876 [Alkalispirochaeta americana]|uniref:Uncharacterized protein n=1 Tax=Alkalispirochaeta americana TaxID=159291 RepID=A0A1N6SGI2_9SPIO|nr:hypothetical protein [Alkalispirochaeta americana]SIQ40265.1 hypothetical protein SAMN05920897_10876 [Alkalispirochaeta americana]